RARNEHASRNVRNPVATPLAQSSHLSFLYRRHRQPASASPHGSRSEFPRSTNSSALAPARQQSDLGYLAPPIVGWTRGISRLSVCRTRLIRPAKRLPTAENHRPTQAPRTANLQP